jgi:hypothetical protein
MSGQYAYVANSSAGLAVVELADPRSPTIVGTVVTSFSATNVAVQGQFAYVLGRLSMPSRGYLAVVDVSDPYSPQITGTVDLEDWPSGLAVSGEFVYVANEDEGFRIVYVGYPDYPWIVSTLPLPAHARGVDVSGSHAYVAALNAGLQVIDITNPYSPWIAGAVTTPFAWDVAVSGSIAYVADSYCGLQVIDVTDVGAMRIIGGAVWGTETITVSGDLVLVPWDVTYLLPIQCSTATLSPLPMPEDLATCLEAVPNPARGKTTIRLALQAAGRVAAAIYDVSGRRVRHLSDEILAAGPHEVPWDGRDNAGREVASGVYLARVSTPEGTHTARVVIMR